MTSDRISFACPFCDNPIRARPEAAGKTGECKSCGMPVEVPSPADLDTSPAIETIVEPAEVEAVAVASPGVRKTDQSYCGIALFYEILALSLLGIGLFILAMTWVLSALQDGPVAATFAGFALGIMVCLASAPWKAVASILRDSRTTADCSRKILDRLNQA